MLNFSRMTVWRTGTRSALARPSIVAIMLDANPSDKD